MSASMIVALEAFLDEGYNLLASISSSCGFSKIDNRLCSIFEQIAEKMFYIRQSTQRNWIDLDASFYKRRRIDGMVLKLSVNDAKKVKNLFHYFFFARADTLSGKWIYENRSNDYFLEKTIHIVNLSRQVVRNWEFLEGEYPSTLSEGLDIVQNLDRGFERQEGSRLKRPIGALS